MLNAWRILLTASSLLTAAIGAQAAPIYNSIGAGNTVVSPTNLASGTYANSFFTDSSGVLSEVEIALQKNSNAFANGSVVVTLWSDNGQGLKPGASGTTTSDAPGQLVTTIGRIKDKDITATATKWLVDFYNVGLTLLPDTEYWIELSRVGTAQTAIKGLTSAALPSIGATQDGNLGVFYHGGTSSLVSPELQLCASADGSCTATAGASVLSFNVPEPTGVALLGSALAALGCLTSGRRRTRQASRGVGVEKLYTPT